MEKQDITIELTDLAIRSMNVLPGGLQSGDDMAVIELIRRERSFLPIDPITRDVIDGSTPTVECVLCQTLYLKTTAELLAGYETDEKCSLCNLMSFKEMLEISETN